MANQYIEGKMEEYSNKPARAVTVADFYHRGGNVLSTAGGAVLYVYIYIYNSETQK